MQISYEAFSSEQAVAGLIGAILVLSASHFREIGLDLKSKKWYFKILFVVCGYLAGILYYYQDSEARPVYCAVIGGGWIYIATGFLSAASVLSKAQNMKKLGITLIEEIRQMNEDKDNETVSD
jgi:hypothetical protein